MDMILIKILASFLALSQVTTRPDAIKTQFDPVRDQAEVTQILRDGCGHMRKAFDVESLDLDDLIKTAMDDPDAISTEIKALHGLKFDSLVTVYRQFCKNEDVKDSPVDVGEVIRFYDGAVADLPDHSRLKGARLAGAGGVLDAKGERFADLTESNRRIWVPLRDIPLNVQKAFIAAEDKRFYEHKGIDERGLIRAMVSNLARPGRPQGGSTITQQVVKNLLVGDDVTYERKMREIIIASRVERTLSKSEILELYLNSIYLGRGAWGIELAARNYFGKPASALTLAGRRHAGRPAQGADLLRPRPPSGSRPGAARLRAGPHAGRRRRRLPARSPPPRFRCRKWSPTRQPAQRDSGYYFLDHVTREARTLAGIAALATDRHDGAHHDPAGPATCRRGGVAGGLGAIRNPQRPHRMAWRGGQPRRRGAPHRGGGAGGRRGPDGGARTASPRSPARAPRAKGATATAARGANACERCARPGRQIGNAARPASSGRCRSPRRHRRSRSRSPPGSRRSRRAHLPLYDVHWTPAIVLSNGSDRNGVRIGLADGRTMPLSSAGLAGRRGLNLYDVVLVKVSDPKGKQTRADLRVRPTVEGAAVILDNKTGGILAMAGGFSYPMSQLNRVTQAVRQPGSSLKPFTYLAALRRGLQPNTLVRDQSVTLPPIGDSGPCAGEGLLDAQERRRRRRRHHHAAARAREFEEPRHRQSARRRHRFRSEPEPRPRLRTRRGRAGLSRMRRVLSVRPRRPAGPADRHGGVLRGGRLRRPAPRALRHRVRSSRTAAPSTPTSPTPNGSPPAIGRRSSSSRTMLQGVVARGTARAIAHLSSYVGGKTGTSDDENDAWFIGFTNDVTIGVWVGYDNAEGKRRTLGDGQTGGRVAVPIFEPIVEATLRQLRPQDAAQSALARGQE